MEYLCRSGGVDDVEVLIEERRRKDDLHYSRARRTPGQMIDDVSRRGEDPRALGRSFEV